MGRSWILFAIVILQILHASLCVHGKKPESLGFIRCKKHEQQALLKIKQSFTKDPMDHLSSWVGEDCCQWHGVSCHNITYHVVKLNLRSLPSYQYYYSVDYDEPICLLDPQFSMVSSGLSPALLELKLLTHLDLSGNEFSGSRIPEFIGSMRHLKYLNLSSAGFSGPIPPQLGNLTNLVHLDLNFFVGCSQNLRSDDFGWASGLLKLQSLDMSSNNLSRAHDTFEVLSTLPSLSALGLSNCALHNLHLYEALTGNTSNSFFPTLQHLDLSSNLVEGPFPSIFKNMASLRSLSLRYSNINGSVPLWLKAMKRLEVLDLSLNGFSYVEGGIMGIMGNPCGFKHLDLSGNILLNGDIVDSSMSLSGCDTFDLEYLDLSGNMMNGSLPSLLGQFTNLNYLDLHRNKMNGSLPSSLGQLTNLYHLDLSHNEFKGRVPASFANLSALNYLDLSENKLNGLIPDFIRHLTQIEFLDISSNSLQGTVFGIGNLSKLSHLDMNYNKLNLNLDSCFSWRPLFQVRVFNIHSCVINTMFPPWLRNQSQIEELDLSYTGISGELPGWLWNSSNLLNLRLSGNQLTGSLPRQMDYDEHYSYHLEWLDLHNNLLTGTIPKWIGHLKAIEVIALSSNLLTGAIFDGNNVSSLFNIGKHLWMFDLSDNMLSGEIKFGKVPPRSWLQILSLRGNHFNGPIRSELCEIRSLLVLELNQNRLTGHIPRCLGSMPFNYIIEINNAPEIQVTEIVKGIVEVSTGTGGGQSLIDLSSNYLVGTIPEELTNIPALFALNLSYNHLTGHIPGNIGNLKRLESLDLSNNHLSGTIPQSLSSISWLSKLNFSDNHLHGAIPTGRQLQTLDDPSIYAGNSGLCGFPLPNSCSEPDSPPSLTDVNPTARKNGVGKEKKYEKMWLILAVMSGVATGFWGVVGTLVIKRSWREAYFRYVEDLADKIFVPVKVRVNMFKRRFNENS